jgi:hypothetical protein
MRSILKPFADKAYRKLEEQQIAPAIPSKRNQRYPQKIYKNETSSDDYSPD